MIIGLGMALTNTLLIVHSPPTTFNPHHVLQVLQVLFGLWFAWFIGAFLEIGIILSGLIQSADHFSGPIRETISPGNRDDLDA